MNFFAAQDEARRKTLRLTLMFFAAVLTLVLLTNLLVALVYAWPQMQQGYTFNQSLQNIPLDAWLWISLGVIGIIAVACVYKFLSIRAGGKAVAEALGGRLIHQSTQDPKQRRLLNVVEEMAIASGIAVPPVYLIPEPSINAFAAGFGTDDAVIGINQGTLDLLDRSELQGVVAHEFSHILNGDTNINLRLMAILHGILFLGMIGYGLMRAGGYSRRNGLPLLALGLGLLIIGYGGTFFGNMIKSAVSRQREFLADASAVQYTRNPGGIADALKKIGGHVDGSRMQNEAASEVSHMFFGSALSLNRFFATHPPLDQRIRAIEPGWDGAFPAVRASQSPSYASELVSSFSGAVDTPMQVRVGRPDAAALQAAQSLIADNDQVLVDAAHDAFEARALVYAMLADPSDLAFIEQAAEAGVPEHVHRLFELVKKTDAAHRLTLLEMAIPALKELSRSQYQRFNQITTKLITTDGVVDIFEWVLHRVLVKELRPHFEGPARMHGRIGSISRVAQEAGMLLSILASAGTDSVEQAMRAYAAGADVLGVDVPFRKQEAFDYERMNGALGKLRELKPLQKPALLKACLATIEHDHTITAEEHALMQGIGATLDCPLPPIQPSQ